MIEVGRVYMSFDFYCPGCEKWFLIGLDRPKVRVSRKGFFDG